MAIIFNDVTKIYDSKIALQNFSMRVNPGEIVGLLGPNGSGKTTALRIAVGLLKPSKGDVIIMGHSITHNPEEAKKYIGYVPDEPPLYENLAGIEYLQLILELWGYDIADKMNEIDELARILDMQLELNDLISSYSAGMRRKIALMAALIHDPKVLIIDEITANLDPKALASLAILLRGLKEHNVAILISTHILEIAEELSDRVVILHAGEIIWTGNPKEFRKEVSESKRLEDIFFELTGGPEVEQIINYLRRYTK